MKKTVWLKIFAILLASLMIISLFACENNPTESDTSEESGESESQGEISTDTGESDVADESDSTPAEDETDIDINYDSFEEGASVAGAGNSWEEEAFANGTYTIDESSVIEKTADEIGYVANSSDTINSIFTGCIGEHSAPGASGAKAALGEVYSGIASGRWRLKSDSPARDKASEDSAGTMPLVDLLGNARLVNGAYDAGCFEGAIPAGLRIFCK